MRAKRITTVVTCQYCGKSFAAKTKRKYCSQKCALMVKPPNTKDTLCWDCEKATGGCSWSDKLIPVEGWDAIPTKIKMVIYKETDSYKVLNCPLFKKG